MTGDATKEAGLFRVMAGLGPCVPTGVTFGQMRDITVLFLQKQPQRRHETAASLIYEALTGAFPCQKPR